jgi:hypothetical protein
MPSAFDDVTLEWNGKPFTIKANKRMEAIARIEEHVTLAELARFWQRGTAPQARLAKAFAAVLQSAGATVTDEEVYIGMMPGGESNPEAVHASIQLLIAMMLPPETMRKMTNGSGSNPLGNGRPAATRASSKRHTRSRSAHGA